MQIKPSERFQNRLEVTIPLRATTLSSAAEIAEEIERVMPWGAVGAHLTVTIPDGGLTRGEDGRPKPGPFWSILQSLMQRRWASLGLPDPPGGVDGL